MAMIPFTNNQAVIDLISKKPLGLMIILEDQVRTSPPSPPPAVTMRCRHPSNNVSPCASVRSSERTRDARILLVASFCSRG